MNSKQDCTSEDVDRYLERLEKDIKEAMAREKGGTPA